ncbi:unnamed protein product [Calypogeia fissa]
MAPVALNGAELPDKPASTVLLVVALQAELAPMVEKLKLVEDTVSAFPAGVPWVKFSGLYKKIHVHAITPGKDEIYDVDHVGTVPASLITFAAVQAVKPDLIINAGTAGGFKRKGAKVGDVFLVTETANHDRRIPIGNFVGYGISPLVATPAPNLAKELALKEGKVSTGNSLDITPKDEEMILANDASLKDMEGAAVAYIADMLGVPLVLLKAVTDIVDGDRPTTEEFLENLSTAANALTYTVPKVLDYLCEHNLSSL